MTTIDPDLNNPQSLVETIKQLQSAHDAHNHDGVNTKVVGAVPSVAPVGATHFACGQSSRSNSNGDQSITGVGFTPKFIRIIAYYPDTTAGSISWGCSTGATVNFCFTQQVFQIGSAHTVFIPNTTSVLRLDTITASVTAVIKTLNTDGFTLTWSGVAGGYTIQFQWEAYA